MHREDLLDAILDSPPSAGDLLYLGRRGEQYRYAAIRAGSLLSAARIDEEPEAWIYYGGTWPVEDRARCAVILDDLLAELESMTGGIDRCRWPLDEPWPHGH